MSDKTINANTVVYAHTVDDDGNDTIKPISVRRAELGMRFYFWMPSAHPLEGLHAPGINLPLVVLDRVKSSSPGARNRRMRKLEVLNPLSFEIHSFNIHYDDEDEGSGGDSEDV